MQTCGEYTREEINSQPDAWLDAIEVLKGRSKAIQDFTENHHDPQQIIFTGCGSTYHLSCAASALFQKMTGFPARGIPASELWLSPQSFYSKFDGSVLIAISRSGETSETLQACQTFREIYQGRIITIVCDPDSTLAKLGDLNLIFSSGMEKSIAQTRAFSTLYLGVVGLSAIWAKQSEKLEQFNSLAIAGRQVIDQYHSLAEYYGKNVEFDRIYFLGSGERYGLASELNLKMKEMSLTQSEAFQFLEFRHGPKAMVNKNTLLVGLVSERNAQKELAVMLEMRDLGGEIVTIGESNMNVSFNSGIEEVIRNILYLPFGQMMAFERSIVKGLDPDHPNNLSSVVKL